MPRTSEAPFALVDIMRCSKSRTTVDAGRYSQCSPTNGSPGRDALLGSNHREEDGFRGRSPPGRRRTWTSSRGSLPKNLIAAHPVQGSQADEGSRGTCSPATPCAQRYGTGKPEGCGDIVLSGVVQKNWIWTDGGLGYMDGEKRGSGESQETETERRKRKRQ